MKNLPILGTLPFLALFLFSLVAYHQCFQLPFSQVNTASLLLSLSSVWPFFSLVTLVPNLEKPQPKQPWFGTSLLVSWPWELPFYSDNFSAFNTLQKSLQTTSASPCRIYGLLTSSVLSATSKQCFELTASSFLVCFLIFIEYKIQEIPRFWSRGIFFYICTILR